MNFDPAPYVAWHKAENAREREAISLRLKRAREEAHRIAGILLAGQPSLTAVYLFGSVTQENPTRLDFDIDLALEGGDAYAAEDLVEDSEFDIDLVQLEKLSGHFQELVREKGIRFCR